MVVIRFGLFWPIFLYVSSRSFAKNAKSEFAYGWDDTGINVHSSHGKVFLSDKVPAGAGCAQQLPSCRVTAPTRAPSRQCLWLHQIDLLRRKRQLRSEERRVGKEWRSRWWPDH